VFDAVFYGIIAVDPMTFSYVDQISIDWTEDGLNEYFEIRSPQETARCGCGESFTL
jgi:iron-sulfur cluster assembly protein